MVNVEWALAGCCVAVAAALLSLAPQVQPDTASYLAHAPERAPLYPLLLDAFRTLFSGGAAFFWLARFQAACIVAAGGFFAMRVGRALDLGNSWRYALFLLLVLPGFKFSSIMLSEPLSYVLLLAFWAVFAREIMAPGNRPSFWLPLLCALSLLLRPQAIFLPVLYGLYLFGRLAARRDRASLVATGLLLVCLAGSTVLRGTDNAMRNGSFSMASSSGSHLLASLLYISIPEDAGAIADPAARELFTRSLAQAEALGLTRRQWDLSRSHFDQSLVRLVFEVVRPNLAGLLPQGLPAAEEARRGEALALGAAVDLILHSPMAFAGLLARKVYDGQPFYHALVALTGALAFSLWRRSRPAGLYALAALQSCLSYGIVLVAGVYALRYLLPADAILLALALAVGGGIHRAPRAPCPRQDAA